MKIRVEVKNDILGDSIFWEGNDSDISEIRNLPARLLAKQVIRDGKTRKVGMWVVTVIKEDI